MKLKLIIATMILLSSVAKEKMSRYEKLEVFNKILHVVENQYYRDVDTNKLIDGALKGMLTTLDPHSAFLDTKVFKKMQDDTRGEYGGLGIEVTQKDGILVIITPIEDSPAFRAGIKPGDKIVEINGDSTLGVTLNEAVEKMNGEPNSEIQLGIVRKGEKSIRTFKIKREIIKIKPVKSYAVDNYILIRLKSFQKDSGKFIANAIKKRRSEIISKKNKVRGIILDLRSNPGGLLDEAVNVSSIFLKDGIVVSTEGRDPKNKEIHYVKKSGMKDLKTPLAVLVNSSSASASEIVAGAIQDHNRGLIVGTNTFGKGTVQKIVQVTEKEGLKLTIAQYMTPTGRKIQTIGVKPDVVVSEVEGEWVEENMEVSDSIREIDLRNHLSATKETQEEMKERKAREKIMRAKRIAKTKEDNKELDKDSDLPKKYDPQTDYQVRQTIRLLSVVDKVRI